MAYEQTLYSGIFFDKDAATYKINTIATTEDIQKVLSSLRTQTTVDFSAGADLFPKFLPIGSRVFGIMNAS